MEILILGLILVAVMVWASTKIKRKAAEAFEAERIEADGFSLDKPDGFLQRINDDGEYLFDAFSKEFGTDAAGNVRAVTAVVFTSDEPVNEAASLEQSRLTSSERSEQFELGGSHGIIVTGEMQRDGHTFTVSEKFLSRGSQTLVLKIDALKEPNADLARKIELMLLSFSPR
jgi:hypothetical protein